VALLAWLWAFAAVVCYQLGKKPLGFQHPWVVAIMGVLALAPCWLAISVLREDIGGPVWLLFALVIVWAMDTGAYFAGKLWGKRKLIPQVSPNKTWEGFYGGIVLVFVIAFIVCLAFRVPFYRFMTICILSVVTALFAVVGDLFESMLKRQVGVKDSGSGLPGHGGILDRMDSIIAALPIFTLGSLLFSSFL
jgi:phosphatidate cytidylyltransferase